MTFRVALNQIDITRQFGSFIQNISWLSVRECVIVVTVRWLRGILTDKATKYSFLIGRYSGIMIESISTEVSVQHQQYLVITDLK